MKNYVSGWRRGTPKPEAGAQTAPAPAKPAEIVEPSPAPMAKRTPKPAPVKSGEVMDAPHREPKPSRPFIMPTIGIPRAPIKWFYLAGAIYLLRVSTDATHAFSGEFNLLTTVANLWWWCLAGQIVISAVERAFFAGNRNKFTWAVLGIDSVIVGVGLGVKILPDFFHSSIWRFISSGNGLAEFVYSSDTITGKLLAIGIGAVVAWGGDALFDLAMKG